MKLRGDMHPDYGFVVAVTDVAAFLEACKQATSGRLQDLTGLQVADYIHTEFLKGVASMKPKEDA